ncbi:MAG: hypothetical protein A4E53_03833 [Pelotomaculum sp. PtaB.Bin104]|nr:MAG: hypothetical protein A4E53_03833 [Pelotomaculum sp. PtaB.Bin104]
MAAEMSDKELSQHLFPPGSTKPTYKMPDYEYIHREMAKSGVTLTLLWLEYCDQCRESSQVPYKSTQFNKYYADYVKSTKATMHIHHKPGEIMEVDWAGQPLGLLIQTLEKLFQPMCLWLPCHTAAIHMWKLSSHKIKRAGLLPTSTLTGFLAALLVSLYRTT